MTSLIRPCHPELSSAVMELLTDYKAGEVSPEEYNRRFAELQSQMDKNHPTSFLTAEKEYSKLEVSS